MLEYLLGHPLVMLLVLVLGPTGATYMTNRLAQVNLSAKIDDSMQRIERQLTHMNKTLMDLQRELHRLDTRLTVVETLTMITRPTLDNMKEKL